MNFDIGDIILQKKDKIIFLVIEKSRNKLTLEYFDTFSNKIISFVTDKKKIETQFEQRPEDLELLKVRLK